MSHEIRTPLNGVIGLTQLLRDAELPAMESDSVAMIDSCAKSLLSLVDNILDFSKIEAGRLTLEDVPTDLAQLVNEVSDLFGVRATDKGIRFDLRQDPELPRWITTDPGRLRQVLLNLLGNALKFTVQGGFSLQVFLADRDGARRLCFAVADTGIGISAADQARLFTRFTQVDTSASRSHQGTGLGLAISRQLAQLMGGEVTLVSRENEGSCFTLEIPLRVATAPRVVEASRTTAPRTDARILVAEDNEVNRLVALRMLASLGFASVVAVSNGQEAVDACSRESFDLVLMDCQMPGMDGLQATRRLRRMGVEVPVVAFTASATLEDRDRCLAAGMNDYLTKPVEKAVLADKLHRWLNEGGGGGEPAAGTASDAEAAFDPQAIERYFMGETGLFVQARTLFIRQTREAFTEFGALPRIEPADLRRLVHRLRGSAATLGATSLAHACLLVETQPDLEADQCGAKLRDVALAFEAFVHGSEAAALASDR
jgi:CheY-like chemotaxis protein/HPt (histidine-containing phosphotransfer) domain-containing protein